MKNLHDLPVQKVDKNKSGQMREKGETAQLAS